MAFLACLGKFLLAFALVSHAWLLVNDQEQVPKFEGNVKSAVKLTQGFHEALKPVDMVLQYVQEVRYLVAALEGFAIFLIVTNCKYVALMAALGVASNTYIMCNPLINKSEDTMCCFLKNVSIVGALFFIMGSGRAKVVKVKTE